MLQLTQVYRFARPHVRSAGSHENKWIALVAMAISTGVTSIPTSVVVLALPKIHAEFNASLGELQWTLVGFSLSYSALMIAAGRLSDIFGRKRFFLGGTLIYIGGGVWAATSQSAITLIVAIVVMGVGAAVLTPASLSIITDAFEPEKRGTAIGIWAAVGALVSAIGPALGGILADWEWRSVFWINVPLGLIFFVLTLVAARESKDPDANRRVDVGGVATLAAALTALSLVLNEGQAWGFGSIKSVILFVAAAALFVAFLVIERFSRNPLVDFGFFRRRNYVGANAALLVANFVLSAVLFFLPLYMQELLGYSPLKAGLLLLPMSATMFVLLPLGGPIADRIGPRLPVTLGLLLATAGAYLITRIDAESHYNSIWPAALLLGAGVGLSLTPINTAAMNAIRRAEHGAAAGILITMSGLGMIFGVAVSGALFQTVKDRKSDHLLSGIGLNLSERAERQLEGILAGANQAVTELKRYTVEQQHAIVHAVRQGFTDALGSVMWLSFGVTLAGVVLALVVMRRQAPVPDDEPE